MGHRSRAGSRTVAPYPCRYGHRPRAVTLLPPPGPARRHPHHRGDEVGDVNVLLVSHDAGGTIPPMLALAHTFVARGHDVAWMAQPSVEARSIAVGSRFIPFEVVGDYERGVAIEEQLPVAGPLVTGPEIGEQLLDVVTTEGIDLLVIDANLAGALAAAETIEQPSAVLLHCLYANFTETWFADIWPLVGPIVNETRAHFGLQPSESWARLFDAHNRLLSVAPFEFDGNTERAGVRHCGFVVPTGSAAEPMPFPPGDGPTVLVGLSTTYQEQEGLLQAILDAIGMLEVRGLASTAGQVDREALRCPPNVELHEFVDHGAVLPHTDVVVTHAGLGTIAAALSAGVPLVCAPIARDQLLNAARVAALGAGIDVGTQPSSVAVAAAVSAVLADPAYRRAAADAARASQRAGGASAAVEDLESLVQGTSGG